MCECKSTNRVGLYIMVILTLFMVYFSILGLDAIIERVDALNVKVDHIITRSK